MLTIDVGHVVLYTLAGLGTLFLLPWLVRGVFLLIAALVFLIRGDG